MQEVSRRRPTSMMIYVCCRARASTSGRHATHSFDGATHATGQRLNDDGDEFSAGHEPPASYARFVHVVQVYDGARARASTIGRSQSGYRRDSAPLQQIAFSREATPFVTCLLCAACTCYWSWLRYTQTETQSRRRRRRQRARIERIERRRERR